MENIMNRYLIIEEKVHQLLSKIYLEALKIHAYKHLHGCVMMITQLAIKRQLNVELARIAAILHDIATYSENCPHRIHAQKSAILAQSILEETTLFSESEIHTIVSMIEHHSQKDIVHDEMCELLKDADALTSYYDDLNEPHKRIQAL
jgi:HD superfamily phosphodiesterase